VELYKPIRKANETRDLTHPIRVAINTMPGVRVWRNNVGRVPLPSGGWLQYGLAIGSADLIGLVDGRFFALETKSAKRKQTPEQIAWASVVRSMGGFACVVRSVDEARQAVERCRMGWTE
jgi:hypothetical protein